MKPVYYTILLCFFSIFCRKADTPPAVVNNFQFTDQRTTTTFHIKKGNHYSEENFPQVMTRDSMSATVTFDNSAIYASLTTENQGDVNKLLGFSDCGNNHEQNSARLGWSWNGESLVLYAYTYMEKSRVIKTLGNFELNKPIHCSIKARNNYYYFNAGAAIDSIPRYCSDYKGERYKLFPYFGGDETAPHEINILIAED